jgi:hypothetical protein
MRTHGQFSTRANTVGPFLGGHQTRGDEAGTGPQPEKDWLPVSVKEPLLVARPRYESMGSAQLCHSPPEPRRTI